MSASSIISGKGGRLLVVSPSTCFTDVGATVNAVVGDAVLAVNGGGMYLSWVTSTPILRQASGVYYLEFSTGDTLKHTTIGVTYNADHARGIVMTSADTAGYPRFWLTNNTSAGATRSVVSGLAYNAGKPWLTWTNDNNTENHDVVHSSQVGSGICGMTAIRRGTVSTLRVNAAESGSTTFTPSTNYYPNRSAIYATVAFNVYAVWDVPTTLSDAEALEIENDLGTQAGAAWASSGASATITATTTTPAFSGSAQVSPEASITVTTASPSFSGGASTGSAEATVTATTASPAFSGSATGDTSQGTLTLPVLKNNTGTVLANETGATVHVYAVSTGNKVVTKTAQTTNGSGVMTVSDALIVAATQYRVVVVLGSGAEGLDKVTAA